MTVLEVIRRSSEFLGKRGVESPRLQTELLLAHVLGLPRMKLYLDFERRLNESELDRLRQFVKRRGEREPLQHIVGTTSFCGLELEVTRDALIPRPETELLAGRAVKFLNSRDGAHVGTAPFGIPPSGGAGPFTEPDRVNAELQTDRVNAELQTDRVNAELRTGGCAIRNGATATALDFGTGSGCLAIVIATQSAAAVHALDISEAALAVARRNAARHPQAARITFHHGDGFAALPAGLRFDLIISNPPYIPADEIAALEPEVRDHDPRVALDGGADGLDFCRLLAVEAGGWLNARGRLMVELGDDQHPAARALFEAAGWCVESIEKDDTGRPRFLIACREA